MERGRSELLRGLGLHQRELLEGSKGTPFFFVVRAMDIDFKKPALMDDLLTIETWVKEVGGASVLLEQRVLRDTDLLVQAAVTGTVLIRFTRLKITTSIISPTTQTSHTAWQ